MANAVANRPTFSVAITTKEYKDCINRTIQDPKRAQRFVSSIISAVSVNPDLQTCAPSTVLAGALLGESLGLSPSPQLGHYYLVPYWNKKKGGYDAQFQMGYKGYVQLAIRSGEYKKLNALAIKKGELIKWDPLTEDLEIKIIEDDTEREKAPTIGYFAFFECLNGYTKKIYWSKEKMLAWADRYSPAFHLNAVIDKDPKKSRVSFADFEAGNYPKEDEWKYSSFWYKNFDGMAFKTMLRRLLPNWGPMSIEFQAAMEDEGAVMRMDGTPEYIQAEEATLPAQHEPEALPEPALAPTEDKPEAGQVTLDNL